MRSILGCWGLLALAGVGGAACGNVTAGELFPGDAGVSALLPVLGGRGGRGGSSPPAGAGSGGSSSVVPDAGNGAGTPDAAECVNDDACADGNTCTDDSCADGVCVHDVAAAGRACGDAADGECSHPDSCDGAGTCVANDESDGTACTGGACAAGQCLPASPAPGGDCPGAVAAELPFEASWRTVGGVDLYQGSCDVDDTPEFSVVFMAPVSAVYRFEAGGVVGEDDPETDPQSELADSVLTVAAGNCAGRGAEQLGCNDDATDDTFDSRVDLRLEAGQVVTVYVNEFRELLPGGGSGNVSIRQLSGND